METDFLVCVSAPSPDWLFLLNAQVLDVAPDNGFAKVHYGFILKAENQIAESIPFLRVSTHVHTCM